MIANRLSSFHCRKTLSQHRTITPKWSLLKTMSERESSSSSSSSSNEEVEQHDSKVELVILDIDGTLIDSNDAHARAFDKAFRAQGRNYPYDEIRRLIGQGSDQLIPTLTGLRPDDAEFKAISEKKSAVFKEEEMPNLRPFPKAKEFVQALADRKLKISIASSAKGKELEQFQKLVGIESLVTGTSSSDEVESSKPDPDVVEVILRKFKVRPGRAVMVGDTPWDIEAAAKAGVRTVAVRCGGIWSDKDLSRAVAIYDSPRDMLDNIDTSPFAASSEDKVQS